MKIDFSQLDEVATPHFKGGEGTLLCRSVVDGGNKVMLGRLEPGCSIGYHLHETSCEVFYIVSGQALCRYDDTEERLRAGESHYCPKGHWHGLANADAVEPLVYFAVVAEQ